MSRSTALVLSAVLTLGLLGVAGFAVWTASPGAAASLTPETAPTAAPIPADPQPADYSAREAQLQARLVELDRLAQARATTYQARLTGAAAQLAAYQARIEQSRRGQATYLTQAAQLQQVLTERETLFQAQRQEFETQRQAQLGQLQAKLDEGRTRLAEANAQLGR